MEKNTITYSRTVECLADEVIIYETDLTLDEVLQKAAVWIGGPVDDLTDGEVQDWLDQHARKIIEDLTVTYIRATVDEALEEGGLTCPSTK